jgi:hypothetical protein
MALPVLTQFKIMAAWSRLGTTLDLLRQALTSMARLKCFNEIRSAVGAVQVDLENGGTVWNAHVHLVVDAVDVYDLTDWVQKVRVEFRRLTGGVGVFSIAPEPFVDEPEALARYLHKSKTFAPPPGKTPLRALSILVRALHGRHLSVRWKRSAAAKPSGSGAALASVVGWP